MCISGSLEWTITYLIGIDICLEDGCVIDALFHSLLLVEDAGINTGSKYYTTHFNTMYQLQIAKITYSNKCLEIYKSMCTQAQMHRHAYAKTHAHMHA